MLLQVSWHCEFVLKLLQTQMPCIVQVAFGMALVVSVYQQLRYASGCPVPCGVEWASARQHCVVLLCCIIQLHHTLLAAV
jgi:hypothetical protein